MMKYIKFGSGNKNYVIIPGLSIHSVMGMADAVEKAYHAFTEEYTVYLFDRPEELREGCTIREIAACTAEAMAELHIESADVFSVSMGGMIAQYLAIDHPELVHKLILGSTLSRPNDTCQRVVGEWLKLARAQEEEKLLESFADLVYSKDTTSVYREAVIAANRGISAEEYRRFIVQAEACKSFDCSEELSKVQCPVLVLGAKGDRIVTPEGSREIAEALGCELYLYDESYGHAVYDEAPDYKARCLEFLHEA